LQILTTADEPPRNTDGSSKVNLGKDTILVKSIHTPTWEDAIKWTIEGPGLAEGDDKFADKTAFPIGMDGKAMMINLNQAPGLLLAGSSYTVTLSVTRGSTIGSASVVLSVNIAPSPGYCLGTPRAGIHLKVRVRVLYVKHK
jgi:hypothetical protein